MRRALTAEFVGKGVSNPTQYINDVIDRIEVIQSTIQSEQKRKGGITTALIDIADLQKARDILRRLNSEPL